MQVTRDGGEREDGREEDGESGGRLLEDGRTGKFRCREAN